MQCPHHGAKNSTSTTPFEFSTCSQIRTLKPNGGADLAAEEAAGGEPDLGFEVVGVELEDGGARRVERGGRGGGRGDDEERREDGGTHGGAPKLLEAGQWGRGDRGDRPRRRGAGI